MNRNGCFELHLKERGFRKAEEGENPQVGHWDVYKVDPIDAEFDSWPRSCTNVLDNIWTYYQRVCERSRAAESRARSVRLRAASQSPLTQPCMCAAAVDLGLADQFPETFFEW